MGLYLASVLSALVIGVSTIAYFYVKYAYTYWSRRGVPSLPATFPFGNFKKSFLQKISPAESGQEFYNSSTSPFLGVYGSLRPILVLRDSELIRTVLIRDFQYFHDRGLYANEKVDPLTGNLFHSSGEKWRNLRAKLSPTFTSGKLKAMFGTLVESGTPLQEYIAKRVAKKALVEVREIAASYATNVIASVAFGIDINCIDNPDTDFRKFGRKVFAPTLKNGIRNLLGIVAPGFLSFFKMRGFDKDVCDFMTKVVEQNLEYREKSNVVRKDFFQLLVQLRNTGKVQLDDQWETAITNDEKGKSLSLDEVTAQAFIFYLAGFETSSTTMSFCLYEIAKNKKVQQKLHEEIDRVLGNHGGQITYDSVSEMKYLECCIDETLRKYPPLPILNRICTKDYQIPGTNTTIEKGTIVMIPAYGIQHDEKYYPEPAKFVPERFAEENKKSFVEMPYMPFGEGPRVCIGLRMGKIQTKVGLISMLQKFKYELTPEKQNTDLKLTPHSFVMAPLDGIELQITSR